MYKDFSYFYDILSDEINYDLYSRNIFNILLANNIKLDNCLELAAGTGKLSQILSKKFKHMDLVDKSKDMLSVLSGKKFENDVKLFNYDMVDFKNPGSYDCIVILLDSINYVLENEKIEKLFNNCYKNLKENGVLIFDLNSPYKMEKVFGDKTYVMENKNIFYTWENYKENNLVEIYLNFFIEKDGLYQRFEEYQTERIYKPEEMLDLALNAGFNHVSYTDEDNPGNLNDKSLRLLYYATKEK